MTSMILADLHQQRFHAPRWSVSVDFPSAAWALLRPEQETALQDLKETPPHG